MAVVLASIAFWAANHLELIGDFGGTETIEFKARFRRLKASERKPLADRLLAGTITDAEVLDQVLIDWELKDSTGKLVPFTPTNRTEAFEEWAGLEAQFVRTYFDAVSGKTAAAKNSEAPSVTTSELTAPTATS